MRKILLVLLLFCLIGCATTVAPPQIYFPESRDEPELVISARAVNGLYRDRLFVTVNGEDVLSGDITLWRLHDTLSGTYQGRLIQAYCFAQNDGIDTLTRHYCTIYIEKRKAVRLAF